MGARSGEKFQQHQTRNYVILYVGWISLFFCQRTVPSTVSHLQTSAGFSTEDIGNVFTCFGITYSLSKLASGLLYDQYHLSPKALFCTGLALSGILCTLFPLAAATNISLSCALWLMGGLCQGVGWPACARMLNHWYQPSRMGIMYSMMSAGANLASTIAPILSAYLASTLGWQYAFYFLGLLSVVLSSVLVPSLKSSPQDLGYGAQWPSANSTNDVSSKAKPLSLHALFSFKEFWLVTALDVMLWVVKASVTDWLQLYLVEEMGRSAATAASCAAIIEFASIFGKLSCGFLSDYLIRNRMGVRQGLVPRAPLLLVLVLLVALMTHLYATFISPDTSDLWLTAICGVFGFVMSGGVGMCSLSLLESVPSALSASALGVGDCTAHLLGRSLLGYSLFSHVITHPGWGWSTGYMMVQATAVSAVATALLLVFSSPSLLTGKAKEE